MRNQLLRDSDWAGMAHSLEVRVPLVDIELLRSTGKWIANSQPPTKKTIMRAPLWPLPDAILSRSKTGFTVPIRDWLSAGAGTPTVGPVYDRPSNERGLRAWAKVVYGHFVPSVA